MQEYPQVESAVNPNLVANQFSRTRTKMCSPPRPIAIGYWLLAIGYWLLAMRPAILLDSANLRSDTRPCSAPRNRKKVGCCCRSVAIYSRPRFPLRRLAAFCPGLKPWVDRTWLRVFPGRCLGNLHKQPGPNPIAHIEAPP